MTEFEKVELFILKCASIKQVVDDVSPHAQKAYAADTQSITVKEQLKQFSSDQQLTAEQMSEHYRLFHMLENDIRRLIDDTLAEKHGGRDWWESLAPISAKQEYRQNLEREQESGFTSRSEDPLHYVTFGQLGDIIRAHWDFFGGILSNQKALGRVMFSLNSLRGPIAHCGVLAEDEIDRLKLAVKDWFRLLEGPK